MYAIMKYEGGLKFTGIICRTIEECREYMQKKRWINPNAFEIVPCFLYESPRIKYTEKLNAVLQEIKDAGFSQIDIKIDFPATKSKVINHVCCDHPISAKILE